MSHPCEACAMRCRAVGSFGACPPAVLRDELQLREYRSCVLLGLGEAGVVPRLGFALLILRFFESREEYYLQLRP
jgi:hypothetical protein